MIRHLPRHGCFKRGDTLMNIVQTAVQPTNAHDDVSLRPLSTDEIALVGAAGVSVDEFPVIPR